MALHKLCHILNEIGFEAYVSCENNTLPSHLNAPTLTEKIKKKHSEANLKPIAVYPEVVRGNDFESERVIRWLLNKPGVRNSFKGWNPKEWKDDFIVTFDKDYNYDQNNPKELNISIIDRQIYNAIDVNDSNRFGYLVYSDRVDVDFKRLPKWLNPITILSKKCMRTPAELAELYKKSIALVIFERTGAAGEAILCGCPVISIHSEKYPENPFSMYLNKGVSFEMTLDGISAAKKTIEEFVKIENEKEKIAKEVTKAVFFSAIEFFETRKMSIKSKIKNKLRKKWQKIKDNIRPIKRALFGAPRNNFQ